MESASPFLISSTADPVDSGLAQVPETFANLPKSATLLFVLLPVLLCNQAANAPDWAWTWLRCCFPPAPVKLPRWLLPTTVSNGRKLDQGAGPTTQCHCMLCNSSTWWSIFALKEPVLSGQISLHASMYGATRFALPCCLLR